MTTPARATWRVTWTAGSDGMAHARPGRQTFALCGVWAIDERFAHPTRERCMTCEQLVALRTPTAIRGLAS